MVSDLVSGMMCWVILKNPKERNSWKMVVYKTPAAFKACNRDNLDIAGSGNIIDIFTGIS